MTTGAADSDGLGATGALIMGGTAEIAALAETAGGDVLALFAQHPAPRTAGMRRNAEKLGDRRIVMGGSSGAQVRLTLCIRIHESWEARFALCSRSCSLLGESSWISHEPLPFAAFVTMLRPVTLSLERRCLRLWQVLLCVVYLLPFPYLQKLDNPNENTRVYLTMALVEHHTWRLDPIVARYGWTNDMAKVPSPSAPGGSYLASVKGPAMSYLALPVYWLWSHVAQAPSDSATAGERATWLRRSTLLLEGACVHVPCLVMLLLMERRLRRWSQTSHTQGAGIRL